MNDNNAERIIELCMKWQDRSHWDIARKTALEFHSYRAKAQKDSDVAHQMLTRRAKLEGRILSNHEALIVANNAAQRNEELAEECHVATIANHREFHELATLVREHYPQSLKNVPEANFFTEVDSTAISERIRDLKELEGEVRRATAPATIDSQFKNETPLGQVGRLQIILPTDPAVCEVHNAVQKADPKELNVSAICSEIAAKRDLVPESVRRSYNRWKQSIE